MIDKNNFSLIQNKIIDFKNLERGWCYGEGEPFNDAIINKALELHNEILEKDFIETDAFPGINGEVMLTAYYAEYYFEFTVNLDQSVSIFYEYAHD